MIIDPGDRKRDISTNLELSKSSYTGLWKRVTGEWRVTTAGNFAWLTYSTNYLFSCQGYKFAIDPFSMSSRVPGIAIPDYGHDLSGLSMVILTHAHNDHLDLNLLSALQESYIDWVIPEYVLEKLRGVVDILPERIITPVPGNQIEIGPVTLLPFESLHIHGAHGIPETGYVLRFDNKRWVFPGDIRNFDLSKLPEFGAVDGVFAHLWMGKGCAMQPVPPLMNAFCNFFAGFTTQRIVISHLDEFGRDEHDLWDESHFEMVREGFSARKPSLHIEKAVMGDRINLD